MTGELTAHQARSVRLGSLLLAGAGRPQAGPAGDAASRVADIVAWFGALQAQDVRSLLWSLGVRLPGTTVSDVRAALESREVVRTWPMRGTLHLVPARDARWMARLMAGRVARAEDARMRQLGIADVADRAVDVLCTALADAGRLTRAGCLAVLSAAGIPVAGQAGYHLIGQACKRGLAAMAPERAGEQTFVLLDDWAPGQHEPDREEALATMASRFVRSHGPASRRDLAGWTGLPLRDVDAGIALAGDAVGRIRVGGAEMLVAAATTAPPVPVAARRQVLPGFDEYLLGYKDRSLVLDAGHLARVVPGGNGVFRATLVRAGAVVGTWTRTLARDRVVVDAVPFNVLDARDRTGFEAAFAPYARFLEVTTVQVRWPG